MIIAAEPKIEKPRLGFRQDTGDCGEGFKAAIMI